jgi:hypothetical protein
MLAANEGGFLSTRGFFLAAATLAAILFAVGCGSSGNGEVTVQTGSLSKAEFIEKADAICEGTRTEFLAKFTNFVKAHQTDPGNTQNQEALLGEVVESIMSPSFEKEIDQISELGAPGDYAPEVASFLNALQERLDEAHEDPAGLNTSPRPFKKTENVAKGAGLEGCAESFG